MTKTAIVTGSAGNLGQAVVKKFLDAGLKVLATTLPGESLDVFMGYSQFKAYELDVTKEEACRGFVQTMVEYHQSIDVAALLVGGFTMGNIYNTSRKDLQKMFSLNFESAYFLAKEIFIQMAKQPTGGQLFLVGARPALVPEAGKDVLAYALSKSLLFKLAEFLNAEGKDKNVVTSVIVPSIIDTPVNRKAMPDSNFSDWVQPEHIADIVNFIVSDSGKALKEPVIKMYGNA